MEGTTSSGVKVVVKDLVKIYRYKGGEVQALRGVNAEFLPGAITCVMGPSGSGKTTLLNIIGGVDTPTGGEVVVDGIKVHELKGSELDNYRLKYVGFVFQALNLIPTLTALENVMLPLTIAGWRGGEAKARARELLRLVGVEGKEGRRPDELSGGEQQRVAIAVALANDPPLILADEPTAELDSVNARNIVNLISKLTKELRKTVILATHDPRVAIKADRILRIEDGRIVGEFRPIDLERGIQLPEASGITQVSLAEVVKVRLSLVEDEVMELERKFRSGEISTDEFHDRLTKLKRIREALKELLTSLGSE